MERKCVNCGKVFLVTEETSCFITCFSCRRPISKKSEKQRKVPIFRTNKSHGGWEEGGNSWDNTINRIEGN